MEKNKTDMSTVDRVRMATTRNSDRAAVVTHLNSRRQLIDVISCTNTDARNSESGVEKNERASRNDRWQLL